MLIAGCCWGGVSERGALGFSNEKSLMYWVSTLSCGSFSGFGPPFVVAMGSPDGREAPRATGVANTRRPGGQCRGIRDQRAGIRDQGSGIGMAPLIPDARSLIPGDPIPELAEPGGSSKVSVSTMRRPALERPRPRVYIISAGLRFTLRRQSVVDL